MDFITSACLGGGDRVHDRVYGGEVRVAGVGGRGADRHEQQAGVGERPAELGVEVQALAVSRQQLLQPGLVDRRLTGAQAADLLGVDVHAPHLAAQLGEAGSGHQSHIAGADHADRLALALIGGKASR